MLVFKSLTLFWNASWIFLAGWSWIWLLPKLRVHSHWARFKVNQFKMPGCVLPTEVLACDCWMTGLKLGAKRGLGLKTNCVMRIMQAATVDAWKCYLPGCMYGFNNFFGSQTQNVDAVKRVSEKQNQNFLFVCSRSVTMKALKPKCYNQTTSTSKSRGQ